MMSDLAEAFRHSGGALRPTYFNIPPWAQYAVYVFGALAVAVFAYGVWRHVSVWRDGGGALVARGALQLRKRLGFLVLYVLAQRATWRRAYPGLFHFAILWSFVLLFIGTVLATVDWDVAHLVFGRRFLGGGFYVGYEFVLDTAGVLLAVGLLLAIWRRYIQAPAHVTGTWGFVIWGLLFIVLSGFAVEGLRLAMVPVAWGGASWMGQGIADLVLLAPESFVRNTVPTLHLWAWLIHLLASVLFIACIPYTNAVHMVSAATNAVLQRIGAHPAGVALTPIDLEAAEVFGVSRLADLGAKQRLGVDACTRCGRCETVCPAFMSGTSLNPKSIVTSLSRDLREVAARPPSVVRSPADGTDGASDPLDRPLVGDTGPILPNALWACTTCLACVEACPAFIEIVDDIVDLRRNLALSEGALPGTSGATLRSMGVSGNPWGYAPEDRLAWADGLDVPRAVQGERYELLYWVGCSASYDPRNQKIARATTRLLRAAGVRFAVMSQERCLCDSARRLGEEYLFQTAAEENIAHLDSLSFDRIVCHCPHCYNVLKNEYPQFGGRYSVVHHSQVLAMLLDEGRLPLSGKVSGRATFHDSCYLGRYNGEFAAPRRLMQASGAELVELPRNRGSGLCCGGGGGRMWFDHPEQQQTVEAIRLQEILAAGVERVGVACPFCLTMLGSAISAAGTTGLEVADVAELLARCLEDGSPATDQAR